MNFRLDPTADSVGTGWMGDIEVAPATIVRTFGDAFVPGDFKVTREYVFLGDDGRIYTLFDSKSTSMWDPEFPDPTDFWASEDPVEFCVGAIEPDVAAFLQWLKNILPGAA